MALACVDMERCSTDNDRAASEAFEEGIDMANEAVPTFDIFDIMEADIESLQAALAARAVRSADLVGFYLARIRAYDQQGPVLNAISWINPNAEAEAAALDAERITKGPRGPLHGIPAVVKDNYNTRDMQTASGSLLLKNWIPATDAFLVQKLRSAGAIILAKTNMHEWAWGWETVASLFDQTRNPYALDRVPGGSSGGTGAAIAANFAVIGMGSDTCGSIRVPSAENSLAGIRGTQGLLSRAGIIPLSHTQDIGGPMCRSVADVAITLDALTGYDPDDPETAEGAGVLQRSYREALNAGALRGARIGILTQLFDHEPADQEVCDLVRTAAEEMRRQGAEVSTIDIPDLGLLLSASSVIVHEFKSDVNAYLAANPTAPVRTLAEIIASGSYHAAIEGALTRSQAVESTDTLEYYRALAMRRSLRIAVLSAMASDTIDALLYPSVRVKPAFIGSGSQTGVNCALSAQSGLPAVTVPAGFTADGLPVGVELLGREWSEARLLSLAFAYEQATHHRRQPATTPALPSTGGVPSAL